MVDATGMMADARPLFPEDVARIRDLRPQVLDEYGRLRVLPAAFWADTTIEERAVLGNRTGAYSFPTIELVALLREIIAGRSAIEIGAGHGRLAGALGIPATDSRQQDKEPWRSQLAAFGQLPVQYGPNIVEVDAAAAVRRYRPQVVIGCWVTHVYDPTRPWAKGNDEGVDEADILDHCDTYVLIGNDRIHKHKVIWDHHPHNTEYLPYLVSRAFNGGREFIATWQGRQL